MVHVCLLLFGWREQPSPRCLHLIVSLQLRETRQGLLKFVSLHEGPVGKLERNTAFALVLERAIGICLPEAHDLRHRHVHRSRRRDQKVGILRFAHCLRVLARSCSRLILGLQ